MSKIKPRYKVGSRVYVADGNDNESYDKFRDQELVVTAVSTSSKDHPGFDEGVGEALYDLKTANGKVVDLSLYEYELENV